MVQLLLPAGFERGPMERGLIVRIGIISLAILLFGCNGEPTKELPPDSGPPPADQLVPLSDQRPDQHRPTSGPCQGYLYFGLLKKNAHHGSYSPKGVLMDMRGNVIKQWDIAGLPSRMMPGGSIMGDARKVAYLPPRGAVEMIQMDWDSNILWRFKDWQEVMPHYYEEANEPETEVEEEKDYGVGQAEYMQCRQHHDFQREGNPVGYYAPGQEAKASGKTLVLAEWIHHYELMDQTWWIGDDAIYEVDSDGKLLDFIWLATDHMTELGMSIEAQKDMASQESFNTFQMNSMSRLGKNKWHLQGDRRFHPDNILIGSRNANFMAIIEYKTGKVVWRLGPDMEPGTRGGHLGQIIGQHHPHMIPYGLPGAGNILIYDNGGQSGFGGPTGFPKHARNYSRVLEINPVTLEKVWEYGGPMGDPGHFFSPYAGSAQRLPDGTTLFIHAGSAVITLVNQAKEKVWSIALSKINKYGWHMNLYRAIMIPPEWLPAGFNPAGYTPWKDLYYPAK